MIGRLPFEMFKNKFYPEINSRIIELPFLFTHIPTDKKLKILDFGCNESSIPIQLANIGHKVVGYDLLPYPYKHSNFTFHEGNFLDNKMSSESFDVVLGISSVEHCGLGSYDSPLFSEGDIKIMKELHRVLKKGGMLILTVPFGQKHKDEFQHIYDSKALKDLIKGFTVKEERYFIRNKALTEWTESTKEKTEKVPYVDQKRGADGLVCLICTK